MFIVPGAIEETDYLRQQLSACRKENSNLKQMVNSPSITFTTCPECGKEYLINYCREVHELQEKVRTYKGMIDEIKGLVEKNENYYYDEGGIRQYYCDDADSSEILRIIDKGEKRNEISNN